MAGEADTYSHPFDGTEPLAGGEGETPYIADQLIVRFEPGGTHDVYAFLVQAGLRPVGLNKSAELFQVKLDSGASLDETAEAIEAIPGVESVGRNYVLMIDDIPDDPVFADPLQAGKAWAFEKIGMPDVWNEYALAGNPLVAVVDTGVKADHEDLAGRVSGGRNFVTPGNMYSTGDDHGHGTMVAGIIAAEGDNSRGVAGMCWNCRIMPVKSCNAAGECPVISLLNGITYASDNGAAIVNVSAGAEIPAAASLHDMAREVIREARLKGTIVVASAGNAGRESRYFIPSGIADALVVAATDKNDAKAAFSNYGPYIDVSAPGTDIYTTSVSGGYVNANGTSMSAAFVSGLAGLMLSAKPSLDTDSVK